MRRQNYKNCIHRRIFFAFSFLNELNKSLKILNFLTETMMLQKLLLCLIALLTSTWVRAYMYYLISM